MKVLEITKAQFDEFRALQKKKHWKWPAVFSTNTRGEIWPYTTNGRTPLDARTFVQGLSPMLDQLASIYTARREEGGRIFIGPKGAKGFVDGKYEAIIDWDFGEDVLMPQRRPTYKELREKQTQALLQRKRQV
jgi:hypothetical protein